MKLATAAVKEEESKRRGECKRMRPAAPIDNPLPL